MWQLIDKSYREARWLLLACSCVVFLFCWVYVVIITNFEMGQLKAILDQLKQFEHWLPVEFQQVITYSGRIALMFDDPTLLLCVIGFAISRGSACVSGEIGQGTMEMLLAQPVSRVKIVLVPTAVAVIGLFLIALAAWCGTVVGILTAAVTESVQPTVSIPIVGWEVAVPFADPVKVQTPLAERVSWWSFLPASVNAFCLGYCMLGISLFMSSWDRYRWRTIGGVIAIYIVSLVLKVVGMATKQYWVARLSFLYGYEPQLVVKQCLESENGWMQVLYVNAQGALSLGPMGHYLLLISVGTIGILAAVSIFARRDIPAPL